MRRGKLNPLVLLVAALSLGACGLGAIPVPDATPTPCPGNCPPPVRNASAPHIVQARHFTLTYYDPWSEQNTSVNGTTLVAGTQFGDVTVSIQNVSVASGTTAQQLLARTAQQNLNTDQLSGAQDTGPINGAEIGYVSGAGESFAADAYSSNAPSVPVYIEIMASVQGTTGITFVAVSPLDPNSPDPSIVPNAEYDRVVNSVQWR